jgi:predicted permease
MFPDLKFALRQLAKSPGFATIAVLTLALGIGLSASSFSMANTFLLRDVPYPEAGRLMRIFGTSHDSQNRGHAPGNMLDIRDAASSFSAFAIYNNDLFTFGEPGQPVEQVNGLSATSNFFELLGVQPSLGRGFLPGEDQPDKPQVVILTHRAWIRRYAGDPGVIGRAVRINSLPYTIVGVLPTAFDAPLVWGPVEFIVPRTLVPEFRTQRTNSWMQAVARLKPGATIRQAQSELATIAARLEQDHPKENAGLGLRVVNLHDSNMDSVSRALLWLMTAISLTMLLIACANLASLQVARAFGRSREFAVRAALGGSRRQLMNPLIIESLALAFFGGIGGLLVALWSNDILGSLLVINNEPGYQIPLDGRVFAFAAFASLLSGVAFGLAPAWLASRTPAAEALKEGSRSSTSSRSHQRIKSALIVCELALALALVGVAASFGVGAKTFLRRHVGWDMDGVFNGNIAMPYNRYSEEAHQREFQRALLDRLAAIPGVGHAALATGLPLYSLGANTRLVIEGRPPEEPGHEPVAEVASVSPDYFATFNIPLKQGSGFSSSLTEKDPRVALVNESFGKRFWPGESPVGRRVRIGDDEKFSEIVGVVGDVKMMVRFDAPATRLQVYQPLVQSPGRYLGVALRSSLPPETLTKSVREAVAALDADLAVANPGSLRASVDHNLSNLNLIIINLGISAGMGLLIAGVGLFGVISQLTIQRTRDIGLRMALGAQSADIMRMILGEGLRLLAFGIGIGVPGYLALNMVLRRAMPELQLPGLWLLATNLVVLSATMLLACYLPALRATRVNPVVALRSE